MTDRTDTDTTKKRQSDVIGTDKAASKVIDAGMNFINRISGNTAERIVGTKKEAEKK